jgi:hypothetical protein
MAAVQVGRVLRRSSMPVELLTEPLPPVCVGRQWVNSINDWNLTSSDYIKDDRYSLG